MSSSRGMKPSDIVRYLDRYVIGQDEAKRTLAVAVYTHRRKLALGRATATGMDKSNVLIVGPTGCGKTLLCATLARQLAIPFVTADATVLAQSQYVGQEIEAILARLLERADGDLQQAEQGIVFIDEVDKLRMAGDGKRAASGESVQHALLKIMEGYPVHLPDGRIIDTKGILFICGGAFVDLEQIMERTRSYGYVATTQGDDAKILERLNSRVKPTDLVEFGLIPEFTGRLPIVVRVQPLSREMLARVMVEPQDALYRQFQAILAEEGVRLVVAPRVFEQIADIALEYKAGARSLRGIFEELLTPVLFTIPDHPEVKQVHIRSLYEAPVLVGEQGGSGNSGEAG
ncbi:MAG: AAA family ATPase [Zoogloeaceae bacterium]|jgi:ATP-dependent Clp protease ATP-binding subunit ClpX|nr:AAA family ATPase [Zoogloeaceae bacterium]